MIPEAINCFRLEVKPMMLKIVGGILVVVSSAGFGLTLSMRWNERRELMERLRRMIFMLKGEILYGNAPLMEAFLSVGEKNEGALGELFSQVAFQIENQCGEPFYQIWKEQVDKLNKKLALTERDRRELLSFGEHLGYLDRDMQERTMLLYLEQIDITIAYLREHQSEKCRLYTSLGIMGGIFLTIVMC